MPKEIKLPPGILPYLFGFPWERKPKPTEVPLPGEEEPPRQPPPEEPLPVPPVPVPVPVPPAPVPLPEEPPRATGEILVLKLWQIGMDGWQPLDTPVRGNDWISFIFKITNTSSFPVSAGDLRYSITMANKSVACKVIGQGNILTGESGWFTSEKAFAYDSRYTPPAPPGASPIPPGDYEAKFELFFGSTKVVERVETITVI